MFNSHRLASYLVIFTSYLLVSCSVEKQIAKSAQKDVLDAKALQTAHVGISIFDPATNNYLYNYQGDKYFVPASNTKIPTCYAAMKYLGDSLVGLRYKFLDEKILLIQPAGDPTFLHTDFKRQTVYHFLKSTNNNQMIIMVDPKWQEDAHGSGWSWNDYDQTYMAERSAMPIYGNVVKFRYNKGKFLSSPKYFKVENDIYDGDVIKVMDSISNRFTVERNLAENRFFLKSINQTTENIEIPFVTKGAISGLLKDTLNKSVSADYYMSLGKNATIIHSQPTDSLLKPMMHRSDNFFAEQSLLMVSNERLGVMNDAKIIDTILKTDFKDLPQKPRWVDGSGLSRYNLFTPQDFVAILNKMQKEFPMARIKEIFPTGGEGTISSYYKADSGYIYGKTGTLSGVVAFSGFLYTKKGKLLIFSTLVNNHQASATDVRRAIEKFLQGIRNKY